MLIGRNNLTTPTDGLDTGEFSDVDIVLNDARQWTIGTSSCGTDSKDVQIVWDGRDETGQFQASGTYLLVLSVDGAIETHKLTLLH